MISPTSPRTTSSASRSSAGRRAPCTARMRSARSSKFSPAAVEGRRRARSPSLAATSTLLKAVGRCSGGTERFGGSLGLGYVSTSGFLPINNYYSNFTVSSALDYQPIEALKLAFSARYSDSHFEFPTESAGDRLSPLDPDQFQDRQRLLLALADHSYGYPLVGAGATAGIQSHRHSLR